MERVGEIQRWWPSGCRVALLGLKLILAGSLMAEFLTACLLDLDWEIPAGPEQPSRAPCESPDPPKSPQPRLAAAFVEDLQEAQGRWRRHSEAAWAMQ